MSARPESDWYQQRDVLPHDRVQAVQDAAEVRVANDQLERAIKQARHTTPPRIPPSSLSPSLRPPSHQHYATCSQYERLLDATGIGVQGNHDGGRAGVHGYAGKRSHPTAHLARPASFVLSVCTITYRQGPLII